MCLDNIEKVKLHKKIGYKVFFNKTGLKPICEIQHTPYNQYEWITDNADIELKSKNGKYTTGFHIFTNKKFLIRLAYDVIHRVEFGDVVATGKQFGHNVVVARKMKILEEVK